MIAAAAFAFTLKNFDVNGHCSGVAPGLASALRMGRATGWFRPWIEIGGQYWLASQEITITKAQQPSSKMSLPNSEGRLLVGASVVLSR